MDNELYLQLGKFIVLFQRVEELATDIVVEIVNGNDEFVRILVRKHDFISLVITSDVIFSRYIDERTINDGEKKIFHKLIVKCSKLAEIRNNLVHSQYYDLIENSKPIKLIRENSKLSGSKGERVEETIDLDIEAFDSYYLQVNEVIDELEKFRLKIIDWNDPCWKDF